MNRARSKDTAHTNALPGSGIVFDLTPTFSDGEMSRRSHRWRTRRAQNGAQPRNFVKMIRYFVEAPGVEPMRWVRTETRRDADLPTKPKKSFGQVAPVRSRAVPHEAV
jgi:hypothetical protein